MKYHIKIGHQFLQQLDDYPIIRWTTMREDARIFDSLSHAQAVAATWQIEGAMVVPCK